MELERMRRVLAEKAMGWREERGHWFDPLKECDSPLWMCEVADWTPEEDWEHCGKVVEAMREKGYLDTVTACYLIDKGRIRASWFNPQNGRHWWAYAETEPPARMLAAARALEAANGARPG